MKSLKHILEQMITSLNGELLSFGEMESICKSMNRRTSNGERRLRESDKVNTIFNTKGHIVGYKSKVVQKRYPSQIKMMGMGVV